MRFLVKWWQLIPYEVAVLSLGIVIGASWPIFFSRYLYFLLFLFAVCGAYALYFLINQMEE